jgi:single-stranded DNA-binding protein
MTKYKTQNTWHLKGKPGKPRVGQTDSGTKYYTASISTYGGKNSDGEALYNYVSFTLWGELAELGNTIEYGDTVYLKGIPEAKAWLTPEGEIRTELKIVIFNKPENIEIIKDSQTTFNDATPVDEF